MQQSSINNIKYWGTICPYLIIVGNLHPCKYDDDDADDDGDGDDADDDADADGSRRQDQHSEESGENEPNQTTERGDQITGDTQRIRPITRH